MPPNPVMTFFDFDSYSRRHERGGELPARKTVSDNCFDNCRPSMAKTGCEASLTCGGVTEVSSEQLSLGGM